MTWLSRVAVLATLLAGVCWWVMQPYERLLAVAVSHALALAGVHLRLGRVSIAAPFDLGLFAALCLATQRVSWGGRLRAIGIGIPLMMLVEVLSVASSIALMLCFRDHPGAATTARRAGFYLVDTVPWVSAGLMWLALMSPWPAPRPVRGAGGLRGVRRR